jgi:hypothetical protein
MHDATGYVTYLQFENTSGVPGLIRVGGGSRHLTLRVESGKVRGLGPLDVTPYVDARGDLPIDFEGFEGVIRACKAPPL